MNYEYSLHYADENYQSVLLSAIENASERVLLETMNLDHLGGMGEVLDATLTARKRGAEILMVYDRYSYLSILGSSGLRALRTFHSRLNKLKLSGVDLQVVGRRQVNPFAGRHHAKAVVADNTVFFAGGINLSNSSFKTKDFMMEIESGDIADLLYDELPAIAVDRAVDEVLYDDGTNRLLIDGGQPGKSLIYDTVCELASKATKAWYVSKLAPDKHLRNLLEQIDSTYIHNLPATANLFDSVAIAIDQKKYPVKNSYSTDQELHAKFCVFQMPEGHLESVSGSHNFNSRGVAFGTQEMALHTKDQRLAADLLKFASQLSVDEAV